MTTNNEIFTDNTADINITIDDNYKFDLAGLKNSLDINCNTTLNNGVIPGGSWSSYNSGSYNITGAGQNSIYSVINNQTLQTPYVMNSSGKIEIAGEQADINMNGKSLRTWMEAVEQRLAILQPNPALEAEWSELKELGDRYRNLEKDIKEKMKAWDILKQPE